MLTFLKKKIEGLWNRLILKSSVIQAFYRWMGAIDDSVSANFELSKTIGDELVEQRKMIEKMNKVLILLLKKDPSIAKIINEAMGSESIPKKSEMN